MEPINYMLDIASPIQMAIKGYGLGRQEIEQNQIMAERAQMMDLRAAQEARAAAAAEEQRAAAAQARAKAEAMQAQLVDLRERALNGTLTVDALNQFSLANAETFADFTTAFKQMEADKSRPQVQFAIETAIPALSGNPDRALAIIDERIAAAENAGELQEAQALRADRAILEADPQAYGVSSLSMLVATGAIDNAQADTILKLSGQGAETTEAVRTLQQRAELAGLMPGTPEYNQFMISGGKPPEGMVFRSLPGGGFELVQGSGAGAGQGAKPTEGQLAATAYLQRMVGSEADLSELEAEGDVALPFGANLVVDTTFEGLLSLSEGQQRLLQAQRDWVRAKLRKESGAEIPPAEMMAEMRTYFPQPGDGQKTIAQKRAARARAMTQMEIMSGAEPGAEEVPPTSELPEAFINNPTVQRLVRENANVGVTAESIWNAMTAEERAAYGG